MVKVVSIVGQSAAGKTTLIENLLPVLNEAGIKVVVVKHAANGFEMDREGKDSDRIFKSGADVALVSKNMFAFVKRTDNDNLDSFLNFFENYDLVLTEGFSRERYPKIVVGEREVSPPVICRIDSDKVKDSETVRKLGELIIKIVKTEMRDRGGKLRR